MPINMHKSEEEWEKAYLLSVALWNQWYLTTASEVQSLLREESTGVGEELLQATSDLTEISVAVIQNHPILLKPLRMAAGPPMARDRLAGLAGVSRTIVERLEKGEATRDGDAVKLSIEAMVSVLRTSLDTQLTPWVSENRKPTHEERTTFLTVLSERLTQARVNPALRNKQEERQLSRATAILTEHGYTEKRPQEGIRSMEPGTFWQRLTITANGVQIPVDLVIQPWGADSGDLPILIEAKSAGDDANTNKRRKEEANKFNNLKAEFGNPKYFLLLGGYFPVTYLRYNKDHGIDWLWEHNLDADMSSAGLI